MNKISLNLLIDNSLDADVKRGWIRLNFETRTHKIKREKVYKIKYGDAIVYRVVLGNDIKGKEKKLLIDKYTRDKLNVDLNREYQLIFCEASTLERLFCFYWNHPDYTFRAGYQLAWIIGGLGIIFSIIGILF